MVPFNDLGTVRCLGSLKGPLIEPPSCRETPVCRTAVRVIVEGFLQQVYAGILFGFRKEQTPQYDSDVMVWGVFSVSEINIDDIHTSKISYYTFNLPHKNVILLECSPEK